MRNRQQFTRFSAIYLIQVLAQRDIYIYICLIHINLFLKDTTSYISYNWYFLSTEACVDTKVPRRKVNISGSFLFLIMRETTYERWSRTLVKGTMLLEQSEVSRSLVQTSVCRVIYISICSESEDYSKVLFLLTNSLWAIVSNPILLASVEKTKSSRWKMRNDW